MFPSLKTLTLGCNGRKVLKLLKIFHLILTDDNFTTIVDTVFEGRTIFKI